MGSFTITATDGHGGVLDRRTAATPTGARRSLAAMAERVNRAQLDTVERDALVRAVGEWDGRGDFTGRIGTWNRTPRSGVTFAATRG